MGPGTLANSQELCEDFYTVMLMNTEKITTIKCLGPVTSQREIMHTQKLLSTKDILNQKKFHIALLFWALREMEESPNV